MKTRRSFLQIVSAIFASVPALAARKPAPAPYRPVGMNASGMSFADWQKLHCDFYGDGERTVFQSGYPMIRCLPDNRPSLIWARIPVYVRDGYVLLSMPHRSCWGGNGMGGCSLQHPDGKWESIFTPQRMMETLWHNCFFRAEGVTLNADRFFVESYSGEEMNIYETPRRVTQNEGQRYRDWQNSLYAQPTDESK